MFDLVIRNGTVIDGSGQPRRIADVAVQDGRIAAVGANLGGGKREHIAKFLQQHGPIDSETTQNVQPRLELGPPKQNKRLRRSQFRSRNEQRRQTVGFARARHDEVNPLSGKLRKGVAQHRLDYLHVAGLQQRVGHRLAQAAAPRDRQPVRRHAGSNRGDEI